MYCWTRPEDMDDNERAVQPKTSAPDLGAEMATTLASASIVIHDNPSYSQKLISGTDTVFSFALDKSRRTPYFWNNPNSDEFYNSRGYRDEYIWAAAWILYASGGLIELNSGWGHGLIDAINAAFLASVFDDYLNEVDATRWNCGDEFISSGMLRQHTISQANYILGKNPMNMSYVVGYMLNFPKHVHHRGASIPHNGVKYLFIGGWKWRDDPNPNPNVIEGPMVGGPNAHDQFQDKRKNSGCTEPTLVGNAGLVASLVSLTRIVGLRIDKNNIFPGTRPLSLENKVMPWRSDSGLNDGANLTGDGRALVWVYYDAGNSIKFLFLMSFSMTMLNWSVIEYEYKYRVMGEYDHIRNLIKWDNDYVLLTSQSSSSNVDKIYTQVGQSNHTYAPDDVCLSCMLLFMVQKKLSMAQMWFIL